jgi:hypothetical protein
MVNFSALFGHQLPIGLILQGNELLNKHWEQAQTFLPVLEGLPIPSSTFELWKWSNRWEPTPVKELTKYKTITFDGPDSFNLKFKENTVELWHMVRWYQFLTDDSISTKLRGVCEFLASVLKTELVIYLPESAYKPSTVYDLVYEGATIEQVIEWLQTNCGNPAKRLIDIYPNDTDPERGNGYFIDTFPLY